MRPILVLKDANGPFLSYNGSRISVGPEIGKTEIFDIDTGKNLGTFRDERSDVAVLSPDGKIVKIFGKGVHTNYEIDSGKRLSSASILMYQDGNKVGGMRVYYRGGSNTRNISSDMNFVANSFIAKGEERLNKDRPVIILGQLSDNSLVRSFRPKDGSDVNDVWDNVTISGDGQLIAATRSSFTDKRRDQVVVWNAITGEIMFALPFRSAWISLSDDGSRLALENGGKVECWNIPTGKLVSTLATKTKGNVIRVLDGVLSPDGSLLVTTGNNEIYFWNADTGQLRTLQDQSLFSNSFAKAIVFSGNGKRIAVGTDTEVVTIWSVDDILNMARTQ